jgi:hypothetical protein
MESKKEKIAFAKLRAARIGYDLVNSNAVYKVVKSGQGYWDADGIGRGSLNEMTSFIDGMWEYAMAIEDAKHKAERDNQ